MSKVYKVVYNRGTQNDPGEHFFCSICGFMLRSEKDLQSHSDHSCCLECFMTFGEAKKTEWENGWRPKKREIRKYINNRKRLIINTTKRQETI